MVQAYHVYLLSFDGPCIWSARRDDAREMGSDKDIGRCRVGSQNGVDVLYPVLLANQQVLSWETKQMGPIRNSNHHYKSGPN